MVSPPVASVRSDASTSFSIVSSALSGSCHSAPHARARAAAAAAAASVLRVLPLLGAARLS
jgi:hypothetical protein